jgi:hypothetical protein
VVERWIPKTEKDEETGENKFSPYGSRIDLFGIIDIVAIYPDYTLGIQATSASNHSSHRKKLRESENSRRWLTDPNRRLEIWSWRKRNVKTVSKKARNPFRVEWVPRKEAITLSDLECATPQPPGLEQECSP